jgi:hypothetical protein
MVQKSELAFVPHGTKCRGLRYITFEGDHF